MKKHPSLYATSAALYIVAVALCIYTFSHSVVRETIVIPITMLGLFVLSAAVMAYLFFYVPLYLFFDDRKPEAARHFLQTVGFFAIYVAIAIANLLLI